MNDVTILLIDYSFVVYFLFISLFYIFLLFISIPSIVNYFKESVYGDIFPLLNLDLLPTVTVLVPVYNEKQTILNTVKALLHSEYKNMNVVVINDGSTDETLQNMIDAFDLVPAVYAGTPRLVSGDIKEYFASDMYPQLIVVDKEHTGKGESLNIGINVACQSSLFLTIDADTIIEADAIKRMITSMLLHNHTIVEGGSVNIANDCVIKNGRIIEKRMPKMLVPAMQSCEYLRAYLFGRIGWNYLGGNIILPGTLTLLDSRLVFESGGFPQKALSEDMQLIVGLHYRLLRQKKTYRIGYTPAAYAWTIAPSNLAALWSQRKRWHQGLLQSLLRYWFMVLNPRYGLLGMVVFPFFWIGEFASPVIEFAAYIFVGLSYYYHIIDWTYILLFFAAGFGLSTFITITTALMNFISFNVYGKTSDMWKFFIMAIVENFGYRQYLILCRVYATFEYLFTKKQHDSKSFKR